MWHNRYAICFNTSHVVIYLKLNANGTHKFSKFQYISCCYLSGHFQSKWIDKIGFNTSHVVIYQICFPSPTHSKDVSIHLMLLFICVRDSIMGIEPQFQYISCCYLSPDHLKMQPFEPAFQYISCCYLSETTQIYLDLSEEFQYISCCYLSQHASKSKRSCKVSIHLMLLFISFRSYAFKSSKCVSIHLMLLFISQMFILSLPTK